MGIIFTSENLQIASTITGILVSIIAVIISVFSLKLTQRSIEEANRPYVVVYRDYIQVLSTVHEYIIIKNFGNTGAIIDSINFHPNYVDSIRKQNIFANINNSFIAPKQSISTVSAHNVFEGDRNGLIEVTIKYHAGKKKYKDIITLNEELIHDLSYVKSKPSRNTSIEEIVSKATEELLRRNL